MKHKIKIILLLLGMFLLSQIIGLFVANSYNTFSKGTLPEWIQPPEQISPQISLVSIFIAILIGIILMLVLMNFKAEIFFRVWFFLVVNIALAITLNSVLSRFMVPFLAAFLISLPFTYLKVYKRNIILHNLTEVLIYPGIATLFIPLLNIWTSVILLIVISVYDMYAVWHAGFMQKMAQYQIRQVKIFSGFFVPYLNPAQKAKISKSKANGKKIKINIAILGGGDVVFPIIFSGVVMFTLGLPYALLVVLGATLGLAYLFYISEKGKFYPAMPFISAGCLIALGIAYLIKFI